MWRALSVLALVGLLPAAARAQAPRLRHVAPDSVGFAYWAPDGRTFLVQSRDGDAMVEYARDGTRRGRKPLHPAADAAPLDLSTGGVRSPDGKRIAFLHADASLGALWVLDLATGTLQRRRDGFAWSALWSPDSRELLVSTVGAGALVHERIRVSDGVSVPVCADVPAWFGSEPLDAEHLVVLGHDLYRARLDCRDVQPLAELTAELRAHYPSLRVAFSPHRRRLAVQFSPREPTPGSRVSRQPLLLCWPA
jgi:WD40 repeat protein